jgi:phage anti-repressor protein
MEKNNVVDIVDLVEKNKITKLNGNYQSKMIEKIKNNFNSYEQQLFLASFYCYLQYDSKNNFVIDLDNIWKWLGFSQKVRAKELLIKNFNEDIDYVKSLSLKGKQTVKTKGGQNKEIFMLNIDTFKKFCLKACTKKADEIHEYFIKLENMMFEITIEESEELKKQLLTVENKNEELKELEQKIIK